MKLVFPHKEHKDFELIGDVFTIGSSDDAAVKIEAIGMSSIHATLIKDGGSYALKIDNPGCMASVNGRLVKKTKEVREGDLMIIAQVHCKLMGETVEKHNENRTRIRMALPQYVLRGVSGVYFGKTFPLRGKTSLGRHSDNDIFVNVDGISRKHAVIKVLSDSLEIEDMGSSNGTYVNGKKIIQSKIDIGDEIKLDNIRFLIQSPTAQLDRDSQKSNSTDASKATTESSQKSQSTGRGSASPEKWVVAIIVIVIAAGVSAWLMGLFG